jgi:hypothetical protein
MSDTVPIGNNLQQGDALLPLVFSCPLEWAIRNV